MKICFLHMTMGINNRGSEISTDIIADNLTRKHKVMIIAGGSIKSKNYQTKTIAIRKTSLKSAPINIIEKILFRFYFDTQSKQIKKFTQKSIRHIKKFNPDVIIPVNGKAQIKVIKKQIPDKKIAIFGRAGIGWNDLDSLKEKPDLFIALSKKAKKWAEKLSNDSTKVVFIPNPVDINHFQNKKPKKLNLKKPIVLVVAALTKYKNVDLVIKAVAQTNASLLILGRGEEEESLKKLAQKLLPQRHTFTYADYQTLPKYFKAADVFCFMPDFQEAFGRVYIEAMAAGLPIVAPKDPIRTSIIGNKGFYSKPKTTKVAKKIKRALKSKKINYSDQLKKFTPQKVNEQIEGQLNSLIS